MKPGFRTVSIALASSFALLAPVLTFADAATPAPASEQAATAVVDKLHSTILDVMKNADALGYEGRREKLAPVLTDTFDLDFMAEKSAGRYWKDFTDDQRSHWDDTFRRLTIATYAGRFNGYSGQHCETLGVEPAGFDTLLVETKLVQPQDDDVELNYRLHQTDHGWKIVDIYLSGTVSELALRRAEYGSVLGRDGLDKLISDLEVKITDFQNGSSG
jgi:phospholipid transport system substrate-binding protein